MKEDFVAKDDELKIQRESAREKFKFEMALQQANASIAKLNKQLQEQEKNIQSFKLLNVENDELKKEGDQLKGTIVELQEQNSELQKQLEKLGQKSKESESIRAELDEKVAYLEKQNERLNVQRGDFESQLQQVNVSLEDCMSEAKITAKKYHNEVSELKSIRESLQSQNNSFKQKIDSLESDVKVLREANKKQFHATVDSNPDTHRRDKIILESLSLRNQELEQKSKISQDKINLLEKQLKELSKVLENKLATIQFLAKEAFLKNPVLAESKDIKLKKEEILEINSYKVMSYKDIQDMIEKMAIQNVRLREDNLKISKEMSERIKQQN